MTEDEEKFLARRITKLEELLRESREHTPDSLHTADLDECPDCHELAKSGSMTRCGRCFDEAVKKALGIRPRPF